MEIVRVEYGRFSKKVTWAKIIKKEIMTGDGLMLLRSIRNQLEKMENAYPSADMIQRVGKMTSDISRYLEKQNV